MAINIVDPRVSVRLEILGQTLMSEIRPLEFADVIASLRYPLKHANRAPQKIHHCHLEK